MEDRDKIEILDHLAQIERANRQIISIVTVSERQIAQMRGRICLKASWCPNCLTHEAFEQDGKQETES